jgi:hypothetical protein
MRPRPEPVRQGLARGALMTAAAVVVVAAGWGIWSYVEARDVADDTAIARTPAEQLQRQLLRQNVDQPGDPFLDEMYQRINERHFASGLPAITVRWEPGLTGMGPLVAQAFTQQAMFGSAGRRSVILLNPDLRGDVAAVARALCHEIVHAHLHSTGDQDVNHGPRFQNVLRRLAGEGAFTGSVATDGERTRLRDWLDGESVRLDEARADLDRLAVQLENERVDVERALAQLEERRKAAARAPRGRTPARGRGRGPAAPSAAEVAEVTAQRDAYDEHRRTASEQLQRHRESFASFNREVARYNLMLVYPDGIDAWALMQPKPTPARGR